MKEENSGARASRNRARRMKAARARARAAVEIREAELASARRNIRRLTAALLATGLVENSGRDVQDAICGVLGTRDEPVPIDKAIGALQSVLVPLMGTTEDPSTSGELDRALSQLGDVTEDRDGLAEKLAALGSMLEMQSERASKAEAAEDRARKRISRLEADARAMRVEVSAMRERARAAESQADSLRERSADIEAARTDAERADAKARELAELLEEAQSENGRVKAEAEAAASEAQSLRARLAGDAERYANETAASRDALIHAREEREEAVREARAAHEQADAARRGAEGAAAALCSVEKELAQMAEAMSSARQEAEKSELRAARAEARADDLAARLDEAVRAKAAADDGLAAAQASLEASHRETDDARRELAAAEKRARDDRPLRDDWFPKPPNVKLGEEAVLLTGSGFQPMTVTEVLYRQDGTAWAGDGSRDFARLGSYIQWGRGADDSQA